MRGLYSAALIAATLLPAAFSPSAAHAAPYDPYRWCAVYSGDMGGGTNCGFITLKQCRDTVSGIGGFCALNQFYTGPEERPAKRAHKRRTDG